MIEIFLAERCPFCVKVRVFMEQKGIPYVLKPVVLGGATSVVKEELIRLGGKAQVPYLVDPERSVRMYESDDIIAYIEEHYVR
ncbi:MAG: glutaredoxin [Proteobacteria bacterium]|nr:glutaredoxin [Pseudomonadota bacterium]NDC25636.1 glutaredoxin [Pseudomonadota bacterium]NDD05774.1 glutaredoxin [Pseudomonadota bacterium]NDG25547.1 glutaredoxin [Pseudomonadota bacterium]